MARSSDSGKAVAWRRRVRRFERSGLTIARFCRQEGISKASFYRWRNLLAQRPMQGGDQTHAFQAVRVTACIPTQTATNLPVSIQLPGGVRVEVPTHNLDMVRAVLTELLRANVTPERGDASC
jgi:transposase-like protein